jgi:hypothetical protein
MSRDTRRPHVDYVVDRRDVEVLQSMELTRTNRSGGLTTYFFPRIREAALARDPRVNETRRKVVWSVGGNTLVVIFERIGSKARTELTCFTFRFSWWLHRRGHTRSHPEHGS